MSATSAGPQTSSAPTKGPPVAPKTKVKEQIKMIVEDLELVLGDLKDVAKELKEVVDQIDTLTSDLRLEDEVTDSSKTDSLDSSSSGATASSAEKPQGRWGGQQPPGGPPRAPRAPPAHPCAILTVLRRPRPPPPPPRLTPVGRTGPTTAHPVKTNGSLLRTAGGLRGVPNLTPNGDACGLLPRGGGPAEAAEARAERAATRERVRFSETVLYHGGRVPVRGEPGRAPGPAPPPPRSVLLLPAPRLLLLPHAALPLENGDPAPTTPATVPPPHATPTPPRTILRKPPATSTTTT
ncbi:protein Largen-like, partial [Perognathus longimembris pacificus]|uniref:protein Largen-like n=1 Tax=Perognathus longimembris pacificus TaxID=214514 RepID=UPI0020190A94